MIRRFAAAITAVAVLVVAIGCDSPTPTSGSSGPLPTNIKSPNISGPPVPGGAGGPKTPANPKGSD